MKNYCCVVGCEDIAVFLIFPSYNYFEFMDYCTHSCANHRVELMMYDTDIVVPIEQERDILQKLSINQGIQEVI